MKGMEPKEVPVDGRSGPGLLDAGKIDALTYYGHYVDAFEAKSGKKYNQIHLSEYFPNLYGMVLATSERTLKRLGRKRLRSLPSWSRRRFNGRTQTPWKLLWR